jgi:transcription elongation GreA/GreB family factor
MLAVDIVGDDEADPGAGKLAFSAPLARALIGAGAGDWSDFNGQADAIEIVAVAPIPA